MYISAKDIDMVIAVIVDGEFDQFVDSEAEARQEKIDLEDLGCIVRLKRFQSWAEAWAWLDEQ